MEKIIILIIILIILITIFLIINSKSGMCIKEKLIFKKNKIILALIISLTIIISFFVVDSKLDLYINWKIYLPGIQKRTIIFDNFFRDGDQISIFKYHSKEKMKLVRDINHFDKISSKNSEDIKDLLNDFYNKLGYNQKGEGGQSKYNKYVNINKLLSTNNYYLIKKENKSYIILILDMEDKLLYTFITIRS